MKLLSELENLNLPKDKYAIFGSGPICIRGLREANDIDIIVKDDLWDYLSTIYPVEKESIKTGNIEIFKNWSPWFNDVSELINTAEIINGFPFVKLDYVIEWKKAMGREKDLKDLELINKHKMSFPT
jgi:hypothetical protein